MSYRKNLQKILKVAHLLNFAMTRMLKTDLQKKLRSITKRITNEGYIIFVFPIIIAQHMSDFHLNIMCPLTVMVKYNIITVR